MQLSALNITETKPQSENAPLPKEDTELGIVTEVIPLQPLNV